jgi:CBS domain-containing protein
MSQHKQRVGDIMSPDVQCVPSDTTLRDAAQRMRTLDCGFLPISDPAGKKLLGVITDRDIAIRGVGAGLDPLATTVEGLKSEKVVYCFRDDAVERAARLMYDQRIYRLAVLESAENKRLCGVISLNDIVRHDDHGVAARVAEGISAL